MRTSTQIWKSFQSCYADRIMLLETVFRSGGAEETEPFQIFTSWAESFHSRGYVKPVFDRMLLPLVFFPHVVPVVAGPVLFLLNLHYRFTWK